MVRKKTVAGAIKKAYSNEEKLTNVLDSGGNVSASKVSYDGNGNSLLSGCKNVFDAISKLDANLRQVEMIDDRESVKRPRTDILYYSIKDNKIYRYLASGGFLNVTSDTTLGTGIDQAYPGDRGAKLEERLNTGNISVIVDEQQMTLQEALQSGYLKGIQGDKGDKGDKGEAGEQGAQGERGPAWGIYMTFGSIDKMNASADVPVGEYCIIDTGDKSDDDYGKVYRRKAEGTGDDKWTYIIDMATAGVKGDQGDTFIPEYDYYTGNLSFSRVPASTSPSLTTLNAGIIKGDTIIPAIDGTTGEMTFSSALGVTATSQIPAPINILPKVDSTTNNWKINGIDSGVKAKGENGIGASIEIDGTDIKIHRINRDGSDELETTKQIVPTIVNGKWKIGGEITDNKAIGNDGASISGVTEYYLVSKKSTGIKNSNTSANESKSDWSSEVPTPTKEYPYLWNYEVSLRNDGTQLDPTEPVMIGNWSEDGTSVLKIVELYTVSEYDDSEKLLGTNSENYPTIDESFNITDYKIWSTTPGKTSNNKKYLWNFSIIYYGYNTTPVTYTEIKKNDLGIIGTYGNRGISIAKIIEYYVASDKASGITNDDASIEWKENEVPELDETNKYLWNYEVINGDDGKTISKTPPSIIGTYGKDGAGIKEVKNFYNRTRSQGQTLDWDSAGVDGWTETPLSVDKTNRYLWNYEKVIYTDIDSATGTNRFTRTKPSIIGTYGEDGRGIGSITEYYIATTDTVQPQYSDLSTTAGWQTDPTSTGFSADKPYLWNVEKTIADNSSKDEISTTTPCLIGTWGTDGIGIYDVVNYYKATDSDTVPTLLPKFSDDGKYATPVDSTAFNGWSISASSEDAKVSAKKRYLWNFEVIHYGTAEIVKGKIDSPALIGVYGETGDPGETGIGISSVEEYYIRSNQSSGITISDFAGAEPNIVPTLTEDEKYLWNYEKITYTGLLNKNDSTSSVKTTTPCVIGRWSADGRSITGVVNYYEISNDSSSIPHKYESESDWKSWSTAAKSVTEDKPYLWNFEVITYDKADSESKKYSVTAPCVIGAYGKKGDTGKGINTITTEYKWTDTIKNPKDDTSGWYSGSEEGYTEGASVYQWQRVTTTYTDDSNTVTCNIIAIKGKDGTNGTDANVSFANVCNALGISDDVTNKGLYKTTDSDGNNILAINASTIFADQAFANKLEVIDATCENLKVKGANIEDLSVDNISIGTAPTYKFDVSYNTNKLNLITSSLISSSSKLTIPSIGSSTTTESTSSSMTIYGEEYTSTGGTSYKTLVSPTQIKMTTTAYKQGILAGQYTVSNSNSVTLLFPEEGGYPTDVKDDFIENDLSDSSTVGTIATRSWVRGFVKQYQDDDDLTGLPQVIR